jgi:PPOX class probable F420-dependent enzyme
VAGVPPAGLEPAAYRLGGGRSIHLSYEGACLTLPGDPWPAGRDRRPTPLGRVMELADAIEFARSTRESVLVTIRGNGRPQLSNVLHHIFPDGLPRISITADRAKYRNLRREPWAALHVTQSDFYAYVVLEGEAELSPVAAAPDDATVDELVEHYRRLIGEHRDWAAYRRAMVDERRVIVRFRPARAYGMMELPAPSGQ